MSEKGPIMTDSPHPTADEARASLAEASAVKVVSERDVRVLTRMLVGIGAAMAAAVLLIHAIGDRPWGVGAAMSGYVVIIVLLVWWGRSAAAAPRGFGVRYAAGIAGTSAMYGLAMALTTGQNPGWPLTVLLALLTILPALLAARSIVTLARGSR